MRQEFDEITGGWTLVTGVGDLTDRIEEAAKWTKVNGPLESDEQARISLMIEAQIARGMFPDLELSLTGEEE
jgi:hypothetical protein